MRKSVGLFLPKPSTLDRIEPAPLEPETLVLALPGPSGPQSPRGVLPALDESRPGPAPELSARPPPGFAPPGFAALSVSAAFALGPPMERDAALAALSAPSVMVPLPTALET